MGSWQSHWEHLEHWNMVGRGLFGALGATTWDDRVVLKGEMSAGIDLENVDPG